MPHIRNKPSEAQQKLEESKQHVAEILQQHDSGLITNAELGAALSQIGSDIYEAHRDTQLDENTGLTAKIASVVPDTLDDDNDEYNGTWHIKVGGVSLCQYIVPMLAREQLDFSIPTCGQQDRKMGEVQIERLRIAGVDATLIRGCCDQQGDSYSNWEDDYDYPF